MVQRASSVAAQCDIQVPARLAAPATFLRDILAAADEVDKALAKLQKSAKGYDVDAEHGTDSYYGLRLAFVEKCQALQKALRDRCLWPGDDNVTVTVSNLSREQNAWAKELSRCNLGMNKDVRKPIKAEYVDRFRRTLAALRESLAPIPDPGTPRKGTPVALNKYEVAILECLSRQRGQAVIQADIASDLNMTMGERTVSKYLPILCRKQLARKHGNDDSRQGYIITGEGRDVLAHIQHAD